MDSDLILGNLDLDSRPIRPRQTGYSSKKKKLAKSSDGPTTSKIGKFPVAKFNEKPIVDEYGGNDFDEPPKETEQFRDFRTARLFDEESLNLPEIQSSSFEESKEEIFSRIKFSDLNLNPLIVACLQQRFNLTEATLVQALSIPVLLEGHDTLIKSVTGSGKTLAYAIPLVQTLQAIESKITRTDGLRAVIILPTRELAIQTYDCIDRLLQPFRRMVIGLLIGGEKKKSEKARIRRGINILVTTPGRLLDHVNRTKNLNLSQLRWLIIDEADRLYEQGFSAVIGEIIERIRSCCQGRVQTVLLSATLSEGVKELAGLSMNNPKQIDVRNDKPNLQTITLPSSLQNSFMIVPAKLRLILLSCIILDSLQNEAHSKIMIFLSCQDVVDFYSNLLNEIINRYLDEDTRMKIFSLHGNMNQGSRTEVFRKFHAAQYGILMCTDVAARGLDLPDVDRVVQMTAPAMVEDFVHRVGRTARLGKPGQSILMILPSEVKFIEYLQSQLSINFQQLKMEDFFNSIHCLNLPQPQQLHTVQERLARLQQVYEKAVTDNDQLHQMASKAYLSYIRSYASYPRQLAVYLPFRQLHFGHLAKSFALIETPKQLASKFARKFKVHKAVDINHLKRKIVPIEDRFSEFGAGGISQEKKKQRKK